MAGKHLKITPLSVKDFIVKYKIKTDDIDEVIRKYISYIRSNKKVHHYDDCKDKWEWIAKEVNNYLKHEYTGEHEWQIY